ncbi:MAG: TetR/AcrR family transcriptional regulator [Pseudomonadota bacterium]
MAPQARTAESQTEATKAEILRHAHDLFAHYGFWKTNIGDIAKCCEMSPGNLYRYFRNKQAIGLAVVGQYFAQAETAMETPLLLPGGTTEERIRAFVTTGIQHMKDEVEQDPKIVELAEFLMNDDDGMELLHTHIAWKRRLLAREIERGIASGELRPCDPEQTAATLLNALKVFWMPTTLSMWRDPQTIVPELNAILDLMFGGLRD